MPVKVYCLKEYNGFTPTVLHVVNQINQLKQQQYQELDYGHMFQAKLKNIDNTAANK